MNIDQIRAKYVTDTPLSTLERFAKEMYGGDMMNGYVLKTDNAPESILIKYEKQ